MSALQYGDKVKSVNSVSGALEYNAVYFFGHRDADATAALLNIEAGGHVVKVTSLHYIPVCRAGCSVESLKSGLAVLKEVYAKDVVVGDVLVVVGDDDSLSAAPVVRIWRSTEKGLYNPYVRGARIVTDGLLTSAHSDWFLDRFNVLSPAALVVVYEALLLPVYCLYLLLGPSNGEAVASLLGLHHFGGAASTAHVGLLALLHVALVGTPFALVAAYRYRLGGASKKA